MTLFALVATFGAVTLFCGCFFRLLLNMESGASDAPESMRCALALSVSVLVLSGCIALGQTDWYVMGPAVLVIGFLALQGPYWLKKRQQRRRAEAFRRGLVELTVGLSNGLRGGGAMGQTLAYVAKDLRGVVGEEMKILLDEHRVGVDFAECFERLRRRMPSEDMVLLATAIRLTLSTGGNLAEVLDKMTSMMRQRHEFDERLRTMTAQGRFEALAMGLAPLAAFGILFLIDRSMVQPLYATPIGRAAVGAVIFLELIGFYFIRKIVTIEV